MAGIHQLISAAETADSRPPPPPTPPARGGKQGAALFLPLRLREGVGGGVRGRSRHWAVGMVPTGKYVDSLPSSVNCERSEAISCTRARDCFVASLLAMTTRRTTATRAKPASGAFSRDRLATPRRAKISDAGRRGRSWRCRGARSAGRQRRSASFRPCRPPNGSGSASASAAAGVFGVRSGADIGRSRCQRRSADRDPEQRCESEDC
jgi:hypothetical protein